MSEELSLEDINRAMAKVIELATSKADLDRRMAAFSRDLDDLIALVRRMVDLEESGDPGGRLPHLRRKFRKAQQRMLRDHFTPQERRQFWETN